MFDMQHKVRSPQNSPAVSDASVMREVGAST